MGRFTRREGQDITAWRTGQKFLTRLPRTQQKVNKHQPMWLDFLVGAAVTQVDIQINYTLTSGAMGTTQVHNQTTQGLDIVRFPVGYTQMFLQNITEDEATVESWTIQVRTGTTVISETLSYRLDPICPPQERYFVFQNSLGGYDTLRATGIAEVKKAISKQSATRIIGPLEDTYARSVLDYNISSSWNVKQASGFLNAAQREWASEIYESEDVYRLGDIYSNPEGTGELVPIKVENTESGIFIDQEFLDGLEIVYSDILR